MGNQKNETIKNICNDARENYYYNLSNKKDELSMIKSELTKRNELNKLVIKYINMSKLYERIQAAIIVDLLDEKVVDADK